MRRKDGELLVRIAREAFTEFFRRFEALSLPEKLPKQLRERQGVFVRVGRSPNSSWRVGTEVLCCLGYPLPSRELAVATVDSAVACAVRTRSSASVDVERVDELLFEVSIITVPQPLRVERPTDYTKDIVLGRDGIMVEHGFANALILPQVAVENGWTEFDLLGECCMKAGLMADSWLTSPQIDIYKFQAEIWRETGAGRRVAKISPSVQRS